MALKRPGNTRVTLHWRGAMVAAEHGLFKSKAVFDALQPFGLRLTESQLRRLLRGQPQRPSMEVLGIFCDAFDCGADALLQVCRGPAKQPAPRVVASRARPESRKRAAAASSRPARNDLTGPSVPALPQGKLWDD